MKKVILFILCLFGVLIGISKVNAATITGHDDFLNIYFGNSERLINQYGEDEIKELAKNVKKKVFGWSTVHINYNNRVKYDGKIIFSKINKTDIPFYFEYKLKEEEISTRSVNVNGSVSAKITGTIQKIKTTLTGGLGADIDYDDQNKNTTEILTIIRMDIMPNKKVTMLTTGDAFVSSGYSKYYLFGITIRKGLWETIETETIYYELREETV